MNETRYGVWAQPKDGHKNGYWVRMTRTDKDYADLVAHECNNRFEKVAYQVREFPKENP